MFNRKFLRKCLPFRYQLDHKINKVGKVTAAVIFLLLTSLIFVTYNNPKDIYFLEYKEHELDKTRYLINTTKCKIPDLYPFNSEVLPFVKREEYEECTHKPLLTYIEKTGNVVKLKINQTVISRYSFLSITCCYSKIFRNGDSDITYSQCETFENEVVIKYEYIQVKCTNLFRTVYKNAHAIVIPNNYSLDVSPDFIWQTKPFSIFMIGIDSISTTNLKRTMPKTFKYLEDNFIRLKGYNKIEDNTFPSFMAMLSGRSMDTLSPLCLTNQSFDNCDIIWKKYKENGFLTAYGEDEPSISTFNYLKAGFDQPPTDSYLRPYMLSSYDLPIRTRYNMGFCSGPENSGERLLNAAKDFAVSLKDFSTFGLFFTNSFSHDDVNMPSSMDNKIREFLEDQEMQQALAESVVVYFSDHGFRFGNIRFTYSGWLEERLPFIFFSFPKKFRNNYSDLYKNFIFNAQSRLTTPYDVYMTLQHLLKLSNKNFTISPAIGCEKSQSLFEPIKENRSCKDACIDRHWCTCRGYGRISKTDKNVIKLSNFIVDQINSLISSHKDGWRCQKYKLNKVVTVGKSESNIDNNEPEDVYLIIVQTHPTAMFEATVKLQSNPQSMTLLGEISRVNQYGADSNCVKNDRLRKYCFCDSWTNKIQSGLCSLISSVLSIECS